MAYSIEIAKTLAETLRRFVTLNPHQLAGQVANLDFWLGEVRHCTRVIDEHQKRFDAMKAAQVQYTRDRHTVDFDLSGIDESLAAPSPPKGIPHTQLKAARTELLDAAYQFLVRCYKNGFMDEAAFRESAASIGTSIDVYDLRK